MTDEPRNELPESEVPGNQELTLISVPAELPFAEAKRRVIDEFERSYLEEALERSGGNISRTAETIGMARQSLQQKLRELGIRGGDGG